MGHLKYHYDIVCPYAYPGSTQVEALGARVGASLSWHPFLLGGVFQAIAVDPMFTTKLSPSKRITTAAIRFDGLLISA